ncbi:MAG: hypothetical protein GF418_08085 [Chitinivibrionales bacterium]|nr:hypothetical protein [Chitinivibrionales bacterium]MBD3395572.1 hypothetical protein [Chitinivibrionales bacterium]
MRRIELLPFKRVFALIIAAGILSAVIQGCSKEKVEQEKPPEPAETPAADTAAPVKPAPQRGMFVPVKTVKEFQKIVETAGDELLVFELHADWCMPCRIVAPVLKEVAKEHADRARFYKVDTDRLPDILRMFGARGIPFVAFVKNEKTVFALAGMRPKAHYTRAIEKYGTAPAGQKVAASDSGAGE